MKERMFGIILVLVILLSTLFSFWMGYKSGLTECESLNNPSITKIETPKIETEVPKKEVKLEDNFMRYIGDREISFYTSTPNQTDKTPCIGASGDICLRWLKGESLCASNEFPLGTILYVGGDIQGTCEVADRINPKYKDRIDWYYGFDKDCLDDYQAGDICPQLIEAQKQGTQKASVYLW